MVKLITDHIDIWTSAQTQKTNGVGRGNGSANSSLHGIKKLRKLILELAVRGKLVPQDPNDEPASVLLKKISKEKARLIKEGKIKKQEPLSEIGDNEKPFELPKGWVSVRLGNIFDIQDSLRVPVSIAEREQLGGSYPYYGANGQVGFINDYIFEGERVLIAEDGGFFDDPIRGVAYIVKGNFWVNNHAHVLECLGGTCAKFWVSFFNCMDWNPLVRGMTRAKLNQSAMVQIPLVMPPLAEQHLIVAKVDELMALCDKLEQQQTDSNAAHHTLIDALLATLTNATNQGVFIEAWQRIASHFDILFTTEQSIDQLKQTILQLAVMGKLVLQDHNDEPASVLLERIAKEKARLIKQGKIKKGKTLSEITDEDKPFELAKSWVWIRLGSAGIGSTGTTPSTSNPKYYNGEIPFIGPGQISQDGDITEPDKTLTIEGCEYSTIAEPGDILMVCMGGSIGKSAIARSKIAFNQQINCIRPLIVDSVFLNLTMKASHFQAAILDAATGSATPIINRSKWEELLIPLPPFAEQNRIVARVDELMAICDNLRARLKDAQTTQIQLADAIVEQAVA